MKKQLSIIICCLLAVLVQPAAAQRSIGTKSQPDFPALPYTITYTAVPVGGSVNVSIPDNQPVKSGATIHNGTVVTLNTTPDAGYQASLGYPKLYRTGSNPKEPVPYTTTGGIRTFTMPSFPITIEMQYEALPSSEARLSSISYQISGQEGVVALPNFNSSVLNQTIVLPVQTTGTITLTGKRMDGNADATTTCEITGGTATATLTVTAQDGKTTKTYTLTFTVAPDDSYIVTLASDIIGGTIAAAQADGKAVRSGDAVKGGTELTLSNTPVKGYNFGGYNATSGTPNENKLIVSKAVTISATFTPAVTVSPKTGTPAVPGASGEDPKPAEDAPIVIIPDVNALPSDTELSELRLIKDEPTEDNQAKIEEIAKSNGIVPSNMEVVEITLVKVITTIGSDGQETTTITPVQPNDQVKVRIPYPAGKSKKSHDFTILHLKSDGATETYSTQNGLLSLQENYMELTIVSFSPFGICWKAKSTPPPYIPSYYNITLPEVAGITLSEKAGNHSLVEYSDFSFTLTVNEGYKLQSEPIVRISRNNQVLTPRLSDGKYVITTIDRDITVTIEGIVKDPDKPVSNETIDAGTRVWGENNCLHIKTDHPAEATVYTLAGSLKHRFQVQAGDSRYTLDAGMYVVKVQDQTFKILLH